MKQLFFILLLSGVMAQSQTKIEIQNDQFTFEKINYTVQGVDRSETERQISAYKVVTDHNGNPKREYYFFVTTLDYQIKKFFAYKESRWYIMEGFIDEGL